MKNNLIQQNFEKMLKFNQVVDLKRVGLRLLNHEKQYN